MKFSKSLIFTSKEIPNDVDQENISQVLMARASYVKRMSNGLYVQLPLMTRVMENVQKIIREEMESVDCHEVKFPVLVQRADLEESGRWNIFGDEIFKLKDRTEKDIALSPTSEEAACFIARNYIQSHNQLPFALFQTQKKYRDEISPRGGVMRAREFTMKDAYSFHTDEASLLDYFEIMRKAYHRIFKRLGITAVDVIADNGAMGGKLSREFVVVSPNGTDTIVQTKDGWANTEVLEKAGSKFDSAAVSPAYELGHIFALGSYYSDKLKLTYTDGNGKDNIMQMGCYGIGVERTISAIIEQHHDENGIIWAEDIAPYKYNIITINMEDAELRAQSQQIYDELTAKGESVLWDDRPVSAGVKLKDSDLIGIPNKIVVSKKGVSYEKRV